MTASTIDLHAHFYPYRFLELLGERGRGSGVRVDLSEPGRPAFGRGRERLLLDPSYWDLKQRVLRMDAQGVGVHALSLTVPMVHWAEPELGTELARAVNDALAEAHRAYPDRFVGCATLPLQDPGRALAELERAATLPGVRALYLPTQVQGRELSDPSFFPLYARAQQLGWPLLLHPVAVIGFERLVPFYLNNMLGNPFDTAVAASHLVFGGVLDRFPELEIVLPHAGGALPYLSGRLDHGGRVRPETRGITQHRFRDYLRRFHYDTITHSPELLQFLVSFVGADRVVLGSDYCFDMGDARPLEVLDAAGLGAAERAQIAGGNAARLLGLAGLA